MSQLLPIGIRIDETYCQNPEHEGENPPELTKVQRDIGWYFKEPEFEEWCPRCYEVEVKKYSNKVADTKPYFDQELELANDPAIIKRLELLKHGSRFKKVFGISASTKIIEFLVGNPDNEYNLTEIQKGAITKIDLTREIMKNLVHVGVADVTRMHRNVSYYKMNKNNKVTKVLFKLFESMG